ncbi:MAG: hypothetical protein PHR28_01920 [candidate division Zixibacteria bacterium]|nr:hypothetical protein [candidate division Zixibacteria bacterium]
MIKSKYLLVMASVIVLAMAATATAEVSLKDAVKIGKKNIQQLIEQSHRYQIEYDTVIALPVHSRTMYKGDFYLLYFLRGPRFQAEMEVDKKTGAADLLAAGRMAQPYHERPDGQFHYKYFNADSVTQQAFARNRLKPDSVRLAYFGVMPILGKRGVAWEIFSTEGVSYISFAGPAMKRDQIISAMNTHQRGPGNYTADSIHLTEMVSDINWLDSLTEASLVPLKLTPVQRDSVVKSQKDEIEEIYLRFPDLRSRVKLDETKSDSTKK